MKAVDTILRFRAQAERSGDWRTALLYARLLLYQLADASDFAQLADGKRLRDGLDFTAWLRELEAAVALALQVELDGPVQCSPSRGPEPVRIYSANICSRCGHSHPSGEECGTDMGGAGKCGCKAEVMA